MSEHELEELWVFWTENRLGNCLAFAMVGQLGFLLERRLGG